VIIHAAGTRLVDQWIEHPNVTATIPATLWRGGLLGETSVHVGAQRE
jgi:hypothetical protein